MTSQTCHQCRYHSKTSRPRVVSEGYDTLVEFADDDETIYHCKAPHGPHAGKEVGPSPVYCDSFEGPRQGMAGSSATADADALIAKFAARSR